MLSQMRFAVAAATLILCLSISHAVAGVDVRGSGVYRSDRECLAATRPLAQRLAQAGVTLTEKIECEEVPGEPEAYQPVFVGTASRALEAHTAQGAPMPNRSACEQNLAKLLEYVADSGELIIEYGCAPLSIENHETGELDTGHFQPMIVLLKYR